MYILLMFGVIKIMTNGKCLNVLSLCFLSGKNPNIVQVCQLLLRRKCQKKGFVSDSSDIAVLKQSVGITPSCLSVKSTTNFIIVFCCCMSRSMCSCFYIFLLVSTNYIESGEIQKVDGTLTKNRYREKEMIPKSKI